MKLIMVLGYLGSGKTTFVANILESFRDEKNAVIVNDFGARDVDGLALEGKNAEIKKIYDGSIFCTCKSDKFVEAMLEVIATNPDNIIVEASGLANPYTMIRELDLIEKEGHIKFELNVFSIVDAKSFEKMVSVCHALKVQVALSDVLVVNKIDLVDSVTLDRVEHLLKEMSHGLIVKTTNSKLKMYFGYEVVEKVKTTLIEDLSTQKALINIGICDFDALEKMCKKLSAICHRIKGKVKIKDNFYLYEYVDGRANIIETESGDESFLVVLSCLNSSLEKGIINIIKDCSFMELK